SVNGGEVGAQAVTLSGGSNLANDAVSALLNATPGIAASSFSSVAGQCVTDNGTISLVTFSTCGSQDATGTNALLTTYANAVSDARLFANAVAARTPTLSFGAIDIPPLGNFTVNTNVPGGTTVVSTFQLRVGLLT